MRPEVVVISAADLQLEFVYVMFHCLQFLHFQFDLTKS